jgi:hypothetical protein
VNQIIKRMGSIAVALVAASAAQASSKSEIVVVPPSDLPVMTREYADAMMLHETASGRTYLYIEQAQGSRLAVLDVTDPARIRAEKLVELAAAGPFDFVSEVGTRAELIRYRATGAEAVLDLHKAKAPALSVQSDAAQSSRLVTDVKGLKQQVTNRETGTTFLLGEDGLYVVRRPAVEASLDVVPMNSGG